MQKLFTVTYGSKLYGTSTATSDTDLKTVYLPDLDELMLCKKQHIFKIRLDAAGNKVPDKHPMPDNGVEEEFFSLQIFASDFLAGQTYALEVGNAVTQGLVTLHGTPEVQKITLDFIKSLVENFTTNNVSSMMGFAMKQTFDYVYRGERLLAAQKIQELLTDVLEQFVGSHVLEDHAEFAKHCRLSDILPCGVSAIDFIAKEAGLEIGTVENNNRVLLALNLNERLYSETTSICHLQGVLQKQINSYGVRSQQASLSNLEFKSMSHALRVYAQSLEILDNGTITFPSKNAIFLLKVKNGDISLEELAPILKNFEASVQEKMKTTNVQFYSYELKEQLNLYLLKTLRMLYSNQVV